MAFGKVGLSQPKSSSAMRILSWNINGIRTLPMYHPWNALKTGENILNELKADIICFQEVKASRQTLDKTFAIPDSYDSFFSFPLSKGGYSGTAVYTKKSTGTPLKAEEGLSGTLQSGLKPALSEEERISSSYPDAHEIESVEDELTDTHNDLSQLDKEGRALVLDFGLFVLFNLYCPNETSDARLPYKLNYHSLLAERVRHLIEVDKREVIVTGDINICAAPIDHCEGELPSNRDEFWVHPARKWLHEWLDPNGPMIDIIRRRWPVRKGMYTCWNQKIMARETNYGTRIDYFLITKGLLPWFRDGDILPSIKGSDHCPIFIDLCDSIVLENGQSLTLKEAMYKNIEPKAPPRLAARYWSEYSGAQKLLSSFFGKREEVASTPSRVDKNLSPPAPRIIDIGRNSPLASSVSTIPGDSKVTKNNSPKTAHKIDDDEITILPSLPTSQKPLSICLKPESSVTSQSPLTELHIPKLHTASTKRKKQHADSNYSAKGKKKKGANDSSKKGSAMSSQTKLSTFFATPSSSQVTLADEVGSEKTDEIVDVDAIIDNTGAEEITSSQTPLYDDISPSDASPMKKGKSVQDWTKLFAKLEPPKCHVHNEPSRQFQVNKPGPNKGKTFFVCSRPVGPGYDAGRDKRLREEVDPRYRCNFFKWTSEVRKAAIHGEDD